MTEPIYSRDGSTRMRLGEVVQAAANALDEDDIKAACNAIDMLLIGAWGHVIIEQRGVDSVMMLRDLRGLAVACYREGQKRARVKS